MNMEKNVFMTQQPQIVFSGDNKVLVLLNEQQIAEQLGGGAEAISTGSVWRLPSRERDFRRRLYPMPSGYFLGPRRRCAELSSTGCCAAGKTQCVFPCACGTGLFICLKRGKTMKKTPFLTLDKAKEIIAEIPTPFHIYDEAGIRANARALKKAFSLAISACCRS